MDKENFRFYIKVRTALNIQAIAIHDELRTVFGDDAPSFLTVARWAQCFHEDREDIQDEERSGRSVAEIIPENTEQVRNIVVDDPYVTTEELQGQTGLSYGTVHRILSDHLKLRKVTARYVPKQLTDSQRSERVQICKENLSRFEDGSWRLCDVVTGDESWFFHQQTGQKASNAAWVTKEDPPPTIVRRDKFAPKTLFRIFFKSTVCGIGKQMFQEFDKLIRLYLTIPITTATSERAFSALNRVKNTLRSSMTQSCLNHCLLVHIYKEKLDKIDPNQIMSTFVSSNEQRQALLGLMF
ncbi:unnamed protein product [Rotaria sordida]|uniref:HAT C-terminal dimerisation domain-containing protein n=1 Tax=Rotaria sordida TaxID=392033 RepID=A0A814R8G6_9BILA|nr:unnamed protein product [Rotaria sordida]